MAKKWYDRKLSKHTRHDCYGKRIRWVTNMRNKIYSIFLF